MRTRRLSTESPTTQGSPNSRRRASSSRDARTPACSSRSSSVSSKSKGLWIVPRPSLGVSSVFASGTLGRHNHKKHKREPVHTFSAVGCSCECCPHSANEAED
eukprot:jgi/Mesvir1/29710/Mv00943-RA.1